MSLWCPSRQGVQEELVSDEPGRFFKPPMSARGTFAGWIGVLLDTGEDADDRDEVAASWRTRIRLVAPNTLIVELDGRS